MNTSKLSLIIAIALASHVMSAQERTEIKPRTPAPPAQPLPPLAPAAGPDPFPSASGGGSGGSSGYPEHFFHNTVSRVRELFNPPPSSLVISSSAKSAEALANMEEDLEVMSRILDKAVARSIGQAQDPRYMGITVPGLSAGRTPQNLYIDGHGALFILNVRFPLLPDGAKPGDASEHPANTTWEKTKREVRGQPSPPDARGPEYNEEKVESLKKELIAELKNASNIRGLESDEMITIAVTGEGGGFELRTVSTKNARQEQNTSVNAFLRNEPGERRDRKTTMTLRVKKSDADAFSTGNVSPEDFQKKVSIAIY